MRSAAGDTVGGVGGPIDPALVDALTRACEDRDGRPLAGGPEVRFRCPAPDHPDRHPSARWHPARQVWHCDACGAGGGATDLARRLDIPLRGPAIPDGAVTPIRPARPNARGIVAVYAYGDDRRVVRLEPKSFRPEHWDGGRWVRGKGPGAWPLYRAVTLPAERNETVHVTEGEKDADALVALGWRAVSPGSSATPWRPEWTAELAGRPVVIHADHDPLGAKRAGAIARALLPVATSVRVAAYPDHGPGGDVSDFLTERDGAALAAHIAGLAVFTEEIIPVNAPGKHATPAGTDNGTANGTDTGTVIHFPATVREERVAPVLAPEARLGLAGDILDVIAPQTEADPAALLVTLLVLFGAAVGPGPHIGVSGDRHGTNLFAVIVGDTAKARKGTSRAYPQRLLTSADDTFAERIASGALSGEGIVWAIRDPLAVTRKGKEVVEDTGIDDKRLCVFEEEFSAIVKVMLREGNTVSETLRRAWDSRPLGGLAKNTPARCERPHVGLVGHVTRTELIRVMSETEAANGFANRILWVCARRARLLPEGGWVDPATLAKLAERLRHRLAAARRRSEMRRTHEARDLWAAVYEQLSAPGHGMMGALTARSEVQVLRLSLVYALLDGADAIGADHLMAAAALWDYCAGGVRYLFGNALGNPIADRILGALAHGPLTRTQIIDLLGRNVRAAAMTAALSELAAVGRATGIITSSGNGRPVETWQLSG